MIKQSPNKRKSEVGAVTTPKKQKLDVENVKTPLKTFANTPKSGKKGGNKTPNAVNNNKSQNQTTGKQNNQVKTPGKQNNQVKTPGKQNNQVKTPGKQNNQAKTPGKQNNQQKTPGKQNNQQKSPGKQNNQQKTPGKQNNQQKTPGKQNNQQKSPGKQENLVKAPGQQNDQVKSPGKQNNQKKNPGKPGKKLAKNNKNSPKNKAGAPKTEAVGAPDSPEKPQFDGRHNLEKTLGKRAQRRLKAKLIKQALIQKDKDAGIETKIKLNPNKRQKQAAKKQKLIEKLIKQEGAGVNKKQKQKPGNKKVAAAPTPKVVPEESGEEESKDEESKDEESDYEVETTIKPEIIAKKLNTNEDDEDDDDDDDEDDDDSIDEDNLSGKDKLATKVKDVHGAETVKQRKTRYVFFVGNLPFEATKEMITSHFQKVCEVIDVRIPLDKKSNKPRGFAYVEVTNVDNYNKAQSLHHSFLDGRQINVLYTKNNKNNSLAVKNEIKHKNYKFNAMRQMGKLPGSKKPAKQRCVRRAKKREFDQKLKIVE